MSDGTIGAFLGFACAVAFLGLALGYTMGQNRRLKDDLKFERARFQELKRRDDQ